MTKYKHELVRPNEELPIWLFVHEGKEQSYILPHWHQAIEISYVKHGRIDEFFIEGQKFCCTAGKILIVNSQEIHSIKVYEHDKGECALSLLYTYEFVKRLYPEIENQTIVINNPDKFTAQQKNIYKQLVELFNQIIELQLQPADEFKTLRVNVLSLRVLELILIYFTQHAERKKLQINERLHNIIFYIQENFQEIDSLEDVAKQCHLSKEYLARFFKKSMGMTVGQYLTEVKAKYAYEQLLLGTKTLTQISLDSGFSGIRTMDRALIRVYGKKASLIKKSISAKKLSIKGN